MALSLDFVDDSPVDESSRHEAIDLFVDFINGVFGAFISNDKKNQSLRFGLTKDDLTIDIEKHFSTKKINDQVFKDITYSISISLSSYAEDGHRMLTERYNYTDIEQSTEPYVYRLTTNTTWHNADSRNESDSNRHEVGKTEIVKMLSFVKEIFKGD